MKIAIITDTYHPQVNGVVITLTHVKAHLEKMGHQVKIVEPSLFMNMPCPTYKEIKLSLFPSRRLKPLLKKAEAIHICTEGPLGYSARTLCLKHNWKFTSSFHTKLPEYLNLRFGIIPVDLCYEIVCNLHKYSQAVLVPTKQVKLELENRGLTNTKLWSRGVDSELFRPQRINLGYKRPITLYVGRVSIEKNLEAFLSIRTRGSKIIVGDGPDKLMLENKYPDAIFTGKKSGEDLARMYAGADVFVFPSLTDTLGLVQLESMSCFPKGTLILTNVGVKPIEDIEIGEIITGQNKPTTIINTFSKSYEGYIHKIRAIGCLEICCTEDHPIATVKIIKGFIKRERAKFIQPIVWKEAKDVDSNDWLVIPKYNINSTEDKYLSLEYKRNTNPNKNFTLNINADMYRLFGYYLAEGSCRGGQGIAFHFGIHEENTLVADVISIIKNNLPYEPYVKKNGSSECTVCIGGPPLVRWFSENFGKYSYNKYIPEWIFNSSPYLIKEFLKGYFFGDGYITNRKDAKLNRLMACTVSRSLAIQLQLILTKLGIFSTIRMEKRVGKVHFIRGRAVNQRDRYVIILNGPALLKFQDLIFGNNAIKKRYIEDDNNIYVPIMYNIKEYFQDIVYNLQTDSEVFTINNLLVHNCGTPVVAYPVSGPIDVIENGVSGILTENLKRGIRRALKLDRKLVREYALQFTWEKCANQLADILVRKK